MALRIEIKGPLRYVLLGLVIVFFAGKELAPDLLAALTGKGDRSWRLLRSGHVERYHSNLTDHWITAEKGTYKTGMFPVLGGEDGVVAFDVDRIEGSVGFRLVRYAWGFWRESRLVGACPAGSDRQVPHSSPGSRPLQARTRLFQLRR